MRFDYRCYDKYLWNRHPFSSFFYFSLGEVGLVYKASKKAFKWTPYLLIPKTNSNPTPTTSKPYYHSTPIISGTELSLSFLLLIPIFSRKFPLSIAKQLDQGDVEYLFPFRCLPTPSTLLCRLISHPLCLCINIFFFCQL